MSAELARFVRAQDEDGAYADALAELRAGAKRSHWMWFVFPQIAGLGHSPTARYFALSDAGEARAYLAHPVLGPRLRECTAAMLGWAGERTAEAILGGIDALKLASSMTLFEQVSAEEPQFVAVLDAFYHGRRDRLTLEILNRR